MKRFVIVLLAAGCAAPVAPIPYVPSERYTDNLKARGLPVMGVGGRDMPESRAGLHLVDGEIPPEPRIIEPSVPQLVDSNGRLTNESLGADVQVHRNPIDPQRDYAGPLAVGDPGVSASLWRESRVGNEMFRDHRAWQPMDLVTIVVSEKTEGSNDADTEVKQESTFQAAIQNLFGLETRAPTWDPPIDPSNILQAETTNEFKGEGQTSRKGQLKGRMSAMIVEALPSGVLRVQGEKIVSVNNEEQVLVISGLVRPRDINSENEVDSSKIAELRIDYYGKGIVGEAQRGGWLGRILRTVWPF